MTEIATTNSSLASWMADELRPVPQSRGIDLKHWAEEFADVYRVSEALSKTPFVPREMIGKTADVAAAIMRGRELGLDPFDALGSIYIVHGRVGYYAEFMRRRIIQAGHKFRVVENTDNRCILEGTRKGDSEPSRATFTAEQAKLKAEQEYERYRTLLDAQPRAVDLEFEKAVTKLKKPPKRMKSRINRDNKA